MKCDTTENEINDERLCYIADVNFIFCIFKYFMYLK